MTPLRRYDRVWGIQIRKVEGRIKAEGVGLEDGDADDDTAPTAEITELDSDENGDSSDEETKEENRPIRGPNTIMYGGNGTSTRALANEEEKALGRAGTATAAARGEEREIEARPSTEVVKNRRRYKCVPSCARLASVTKQATLPPGGRNPQGKCDEWPADTEVQRPGVEDKPQAWSMGTEAQRPQQRDEWSADDKVQ